MADKPKKPRKIKNLKARLGRTIAPNTPGAVMPPSVAGAKPAAKSGGVVPPSGGIKPPTGGVKPPIKKKAVPVGSPFAPKQPSAPPPSNDPFAATPMAAPQGPQHVRIVLDDSAVDDAEVGRAKKGKTFMLLGLGALFGIIMGFLFGSVMNDRKTTNLAIRDAKSVHESVTEASAALQTAQRLVDQAAAAAVTNPPTVDYAAIEELQALPNPFMADRFSNRTYFLFAPQTVDSLFTYYQNTRQAWTSIESLGSLTTGEARRAQLDAAATAAADSRSLIGCIPKIADDRLTCGLGFVNIDDGTVTVRPSRRSRRGVEKSVYTGQDLSEEPEQYVILVNTAESQGVLGEQATLFNQYLREIVALKQLLTATIEAQGQVETGVGPIAGREEMFAF